MSARLRRWLLLLRRLSPLRLQLRLWRRPRRRLLGLSAGLRPRLRLRAGRRRWRGEAARLLCFGGGLSECGLRGRRGTGDCLRAPLGPLHNMAAATWNGAHHPAQLMPLQASDTCCPEADWGKSCDQEASETLASYLSAVDALPVTAAKHSSSRKSFLMAHRTVSVHAPLSASAAL